MESPTTLQDAIIWFADFEHCRQFMVELRWPNGVITCPRCGSERVGWLEKTRVWKCYAKHEAGQGQTFTLKTGTIFEDSPVPLEKWLSAAWLIISCKNGISSYEISRGLGVTQKTAWFMLHRVRLAMQEGGFSKFIGEVEVDETFIGGKARNMHADVKERKIQGRRGPMGKAIVAAVLERGGRVKAKVIGRRKKKDLQALVRDHVEPSATLYSDALPSYQGLAGEYAHQVIDHAVAYVDGNVHTNGLENFWSLLKRGINGTYVSVEPYHLFRYVDEQAFRFNNRKMTDAERFASVMKQIVGRRLTYNELIGKTESGAAMRP